MKINNFLMAFLFLVGFSVLNLNSAFAWVSSEQVKSHDQAVKAKVDSIELIEGNPKRFYTKLQPVLETSTTMQSAVKRLKKSVAKLGGDAVINFESSSDTRKQAMYNSFTGFMTYNEQQVTVKGWAVSWKR